MTGTAADVAKARAEAAAAKQRIGQTVALLRDRLDPRIRAREQWASAREKGEALGDDALEFAYERPSTVATIAGVGAVFLLRRPIGRLLRRLAFWRRPKWDAKPNNPARAVKRLPGKGGEGR